MSTLQAQDLDSQQKQDPETNEKLDEEFGVSDQADQESEIQQDDTIPEGKKEETSEEQETFKNEVNNKEMEMLTSIKEKSNERDLKPENQEQIVGDENTEFKEIANGQEIGQEQKFKKESDAEKEEVIEYPNEHEVEKVDIPENEDKEIIPSDSTYSAEKLNEKENSQELEPVSSQKETMGEPKESTNFEKVENQKEEIIEPDEVKEEKEKINKEAKIETTQPIIEKQRYIIPQEIEQNMEFLSIYRSQKQKCYSKHAQYLKQNPKIKKIANDYLKMILMEKPKDVWEYTIDYFAMFEKTSIQE